jgi:hypothetical protein
MTNIKTTLFIDPPSGWKYGFPKQAPENFKEFEAHDLNNWLIENGYPREEVEAWTNGGKYDSVPCRFFSMEITDVETENKALDQLARMDEELGLL